MYDDSLKLSEEKKQSPSARPNILTFAFLLYFLFATGPILDVLYLGEFSLYADAILVRFVRLGVPALAYLMYILFTKKSVSAAFYIRRLSLKNILYITVITLAYRAVFALFSFGSTFFFGNEPMQLVQFPFPYWLVLIDMVIVISLFEEFVFRGALWHNYDRGRNLGFWKIALATGLFFGLVHNGIFQMTHTTFTGIFLFAPAIYLTRSIWAPILLHAILNAFPSDPSMFVSTQAEFEAAKPIFLIVVAIFSVILIPLAIVCAKKFYAENRHNVITEADLPKESTLFKVTYWLLIAAMVAAVFLFRL